MPLRNAEIAGKSAAEYLKGTMNCQDAVPIRTDGKIRYTVPQCITAKKEITVYFRVANVYRNAKIVVRSEEKTLLEKKRPRVAPGEMESIRLTEEMLSDVRELSFALKVAE